MEKKQTSFGSIEPLLKIDDRLIAEYLVFEKPGREHQHIEYESFTVLSGEGQVVSGKEIFNVTSGDIVTIPPKTAHRMIPKEGQRMTGLLWYHGEAGYHQRGQRLLSGDSDRE